jgi:hypothetical protein
MLAANTVSQFNKDGYFVIPGVIDAVLNRRLSAFVGGFAKGGAGSRRLLHETWCAHIWLAHCVATQESVHCCHITPWRCNARCLTSRLRRIG